MWTQHLSYGLATVTLLHLEHFPAFSMLWNIWEFLSCELLCQSYFLWDLFILFLTTIFLTLCQSAHSHSRASLITYLWFLKPCPHKCSNTAFYAPLMFHQNFISSITTFCSFTALVSLLANTHLLILQNVQADPRRQGTDTSHTLAAVCEMNQRCTVTKSSDQTLHWGEVTTDFTRGDLTGHWPWWASGIWSWFTDWRASSKVCTPCHYSQLTWHGKWNSDHYVVVWILFF